MLLATCRLVTTTRFASHSRCTTHCSTTFYKPQTLPILLLLLLISLPSLFDSDMDAVLRTEHSPFLGVYDAAAYAPAPTTPRRAAARVAEERGEEELKKGIAELYDESSEMWEMLWGDHMHHGFYDNDASVSLSDHRLAQVRMVEEALAFAGIRGPNGEHQRPFGTVRPNKAEQRAFVLPCLAEQRSSFGLAYQAEQNGLCSVKYDRTEALYSALFNRMVPKGKPAPRERVLADAGE